MRHAAAEYSRLCHVFRRHAYAVYQLGRFEMPRGMNTVGRGKKCRVEYDRKKAGSLAFMSGRSLYAKERGAHATAGTVRTGAWHRRSEQPRNDRKVWLPMGCYELTAGNCDGRRFWPWISPGCAQGPWSGGWSKPAIFQTISNGLRTISRFVVPLRKLSKVPFDQLSARLMRPWGGASLEQTLKNVDHLLQ